MIDYFEALSGAEQEQVSESIRLLYRQTFLLTVRQSAARPIRHFTIATVTWNLSGNTFLLWGLRLWKTVSLV